MADLQQDEQGYWQEQDKDSYLDYSFDYELDAGDALLTSDWSCDAGITVNSKSFTATRATIWVQGGVPGTWYAITNSYTTAAGRVDSRTFRLYIKDQAEASDNGSALFPNRFVAVDSFRRSNLSVIDIDTSMLSDDDVWQRMLAAEKEAARLLRVKLKPTYIFAGDPTQAEIDALPPGTAYDIEAAYDFDPDQFGPGRWGFMQLRQTPASAIYEMTIVYPTPIVSSFTIPNDWLRLDRKYGQVQVVPTSMAMASPIAMYIAQYQMGGSGLPQMIKIRYTAGLQNVLSDYPDLVIAVRRMAALQIISDAGRPNSGSISADGLSETSSLDLSGMQDGIDTILNRIRDAIHGIRMVVM